MTLAPGWHEVSLTYEARVPLLNAERSGSWQSRARWTKEWREAFCWLALKEARGVRFEWCEITVVHEHAKGNLSDLGAALPAAKAGIDGAVIDAGLCPDDGPLYVRKLTFLAPTKTGRDALTLTIKGPLAE